MEGLFDVCHLAHKPGAVFNQCLTEIDAATLITMLRYNNANHIL